MHYQYIRLTTIIFIVINLNIAKNVMFFYYNLSIIIDYF